MKVTRVKAEVEREGISVWLDKKEFRTTYPRHVWQPYPIQLKTQLARSLAFAFTYHLTLQKRYLHYQFPPPPVWSYFYHGLTYSLPEMVLDEDNPYKTSELLKSIFESNYYCRFTGLPEVQTVHNGSDLQPDRAVIPFSFGKDSLLTYCISREIGLTPALFFMAEPASPYENKNKEKLRTAFEKEFVDTVHVIPLELGRLRQKSGLMWGWDLLLLQYTLVLLPYLYSNKAAYFFWSNEQSTNDVETDAEGYPINPTYEQSSGWTLNLNNVLRLFGSNATIGSIIEPVHEIFISYLLHRRYPEVAKYQLSCFNDAPASKTKRWCGECYDCARVYLFLVAVGVDPKTVGFTDDMLADEKADLFYIFSLRKNPLQEQQRFLTSFNERYLAFYLACRRGVKGDLVQRFKRDLLGRIVRQAPALIDRYIRLYDGPTVPLKLASQIYRIYRTELHNFRRIIAGL